MPRSRRRAPLPRASSLRGAAVLAALLALTAWLSSPAPAAEPASRRILTCGKRTAIVEGAIADACGIQRLPSGNTMIASYHIGKGGVRLLEVTPEKKVAWAWTADVPAVHHFLVVSIDGVDLPWPPLW